MVHRLSRRIDEVLALAPDSAALQYDGQWTTWGQLGDAARRIAALLGEPGRVGIMLRNRPVHVAALLGVLLTGRTTGPAPIWNPWTCRC